MKKQKKIIISFVVLLVLAIILYNGFGLFSVFQPITEKITQYNVKHLDDAQWQSYSKGAYLPQPSHVEFVANNLINTNLAKDVIINSGKNEFKFISTLEWEKMPDENGIPVGSSCTQTINVLKNGVQIDTIKQNARNSAGEKIYYDDNTQTSYISFNIVEQPKNYITIDSGYQIDCAFAVNEYGLKLSDDSFDFKIYTPTTTFIEGQEIKVIADINNKLTETYLANVELKFETGTLFGLISKTITKEDVTLNPGKNNVELTLTSKSSEGKVEITPKIVLKQSGKSFVGLNYGKSNVAFGTDNRDPFQCSGNHMIQSCVWEYRLKKKIIESDWVPIGTIEGDKTLVSVSPNPLYLPKTGDSCINGYVVGENKEYCIRNDIKSLGCNILGCPAISGVEYQCTSSGMCAETVFIDKKCKLDSDCPLNTACDPGTGLCVNSQIFKEVIQCQQNVDCPVPCDGILPLCTNSKCTFEGKCKEVTYGCVQAGGCADIKAVCNKETNICEKNNPLNKVILWIAGFLVLVVLLILGYKWLHK